MPVNYAHTPDRSGQTDTEGFSPVAAVLLSVIFVGVCFRVYFIDYRPFWLDELYSVMYAKLAMGDLLKILHTNNQMPLFFTILHAWVRLFGDSDVAVRSLSVLFGIAGIPGFFLLLRKGLGWRLNTCLFGTALLAVSPFHIYYSIEARPYSLMFALSTLYLTALALMHAGAGKKHLFAYALLQGLLLYTHPMALIYCCCINAAYVFLLVLLREASGRRLGNLVAANILTAVMYSPAVLLLVRQAHLVHETFWADLPTPLGALKTWSSISLFWSPELVDFLSPNFAGMRPLIWISVIAPLLLLMARGGAHILRRRKLPELLAALSLFVYPAAVYAISILFKPMFLNRILIPSLIGLLVLIAVLGRTDKRQRSVSLPAWLFLLVSIALSLSVTGIDRSPDWRTISAVLSRTTQPGDMVLAYQSNGAALLKRYSKDRLEFRGVTHDFEDEIKRRTLGEYNSGSSLKVPFFSKEVMERLDRLTKGRKSFFVVFQPLSRADVLTARDFMTRRYAVKENIIAGQAQILLLSSTPAPNP